MTHTTSQAIEPHRKGAAATHPRLAVNRLAVTDFRNYESARMLLDDRPVVLTGPNGAGKTNLLEAVSFLVPGRGLRRAALGEATRRAGGAPVATGWAVAATLQGAEGPFEVGTGIEGSAAASASSTRRIVRIDGVDAGSQGELAERVSAVWLTPEMDRLFAEGTGARRRVLDRLVYGFDRDHAGRLGRYEQAMRERTRLVKSRGWRGETAWLDALEGTMAEEGVAVAAARRALIARLDAACRDAFGPFPAAALAIEGAVEAMLDEAPALAVEDDVRARLAALRRVDAEAGRATFGVHRSDLACRHLAKDSPAAECSTGEQKALLIRIVLANARLQADDRGHAPLILLDEVGAHLDKERRAALFDEILALGTQAWMTGTDAASFEALGDRAQHFRVADASLTRSA